MLRILTPCGIHRRNSVSDRVTEPFLARDRRSLSFSEYSAHEDCPTEITLLNDSPQSITSKSYGHCALRSVPLSGILPPRQWPPPLPTASTLRWPLSLLDTPSTGPFGPKCPYGHHEVGLSTGRSPVPGAVRATLDPWVHFEDRYSILLRYRSMENQDRLLHIRSLSSQSKACSDLSVERYPSSPLTTIFSGTQRLVKPSGTARTHSECVKPHSPSRERYDLTSL